MVDIALRCGDRAEAVRWAKHARAGNPKDPNSHGQLVALHLRFGDLEAAESLISEALTLDPGHLPSLHRLAEIASRRGDTDKALALSRRGVEAHPLDAGAHNHLAGLLLQMSWLPEAEKAARGALALAPNNIGVMLRLSHIAMRSDDLEMASNGRTGPSCSIAPIRRPICSLPACIGRTATSALRKPHSPWP